jgi:hypothetical protein
MGDAKLDDASSEVKDTLTEAGGLMEETADSERVAKSLRAAPTDYGEPEAIRCRTQMNATPRKAAPHSSAAHNPTALARKPARTTAASTEA